MTIGDRALLAELRECVERELPRLDTHQGIKLLYSDVASLSNAYWTVGLNPGGSHREDDQWCRERGAHDYRDGYRSPQVARLRPGGHRLREQLAAMVKWLGIDWNQTLSLNLVPFRSASWSGMPRAWRAEARRFATEDFWPLLLRHRRPRLAICFASQSARILREVLQQPPPERHDVGWNGIAGDVSERDGSIILRLLAELRRALVERGALSPGSA